MKQVKVALATIFALTLGALLIAPAAGAVPKAPNGFLGIVPQEGLTHTDTKRMKRGKVSNIRIAVAWSQIQSENANQFNWLEFDRMMRAAALEGLRVMPTLYATPTWLSGNYTNLPIKNSNQLEKWRKFVKAAVDRYGSKGEFWKEENEGNSSLPKKPVQEWQIWNEANFHYFATPVSASKYGRLLDASAKVIHQADPKGKVVASGLFAKPKGPKKKAVDATSFIRQVARSSKRNSIDSIAIHPYAKDTKTLKKIMVQFRTAARKAGLGSKPIQVTEIGWASGKKKNAFLTGSKKAQSKQLRSAFNYLISQRRRLGLQRVYWYAWRDSDPKGESCSFCYTIGLFGYRKSDKLVAKPAWRQFVKYTRGRAS